MSIIVPSNHTRIGELGLQISLLHYIEDRMGVNDVDLQV